MREFSYYLDQLEGDDAKAEVWEKFDQIKRQYTFAGGTEALEAFNEFVEGYNWFGKNKNTFGINQNFARNFVGSYMQDWLANICFLLVAPFDGLRVFSEVRVKFGYYPIWKEGEVEIASPSELSDLCIGYLVADSDITTPSDLRDHPKNELIMKLPKGRVIMPLVTINSKIRISQGEFFDWQGRETLMTKGNPHCLSTQVALRKEMDINVVEASQVYDKWFLIGHGGEKAVTPRPDELRRFCDTIAEHISLRMPTQSQEGNGDSA